LDFIDHAEVERRLDAQLGLAARPRRKPFKLRGPFLTCEHARITSTRSVGGLAVVTCACGHSWREAS
jgi:hypothetical protein